MTNVAARHCERSVAIHAFPVFIFNNQRAEDGLPRRRLLAMTAMVVRHCERSVAIHAFPVFIFTQRAPLLGGRLRVILARREPILEGEV